MSSQSPLNVEIRIKNVIAKYINNINTNILMLLHTFKVLYNKLWNCIYGKLLKTKVILLHLKRLLKNQKQTLHDFLKTLNKQYINLYFTLIK